MTSMPLPVLADDVDIKADVEGKVAHAALCSVLLRQSPVSTGSRTHEPGVLTALANLQPVLDHRKRPVRPAGAAVL